MPRLEFRTTTSLPPEKVMGAMLDFTERRPDLWESLSRKFYEVRDVSETSALVKEGTAGPPFSVWALERYDWATPWRVTWSVEESNFCTVGSNVALTVSPTEGGGSDCFVEWEREPSNLRGKVALSMVARNDGKMLKGFYEKGLKGLEQHPDLPTYAP